MNPTQGRRLRAAQPVKHSNTFRPFKSLFTCCITGTNRQADLEDAYEDDSPTPAVSGSPRGTLQAQAPSTRLPKTSGVDSRGADTAGQGSPFSHTTAQQLPSEGAQLHSAGRFELNDAPGGVPSHLRPAPDSSSTEGSKGQHPIRQAGTVSVMQEHNSARSDALVAPDQRLTSDTAQPAASVPTAGHVAVLPAATTDTSLLQHQQHQDAELPSATAAGGPIMAPTIMFSGSVLPHPEPFSLAPIEESPRHPQPAISLAQGLADHEVPSSPAAAAAATVSAAADGAQQQAMHPSATAEAPGADTTTTTTAAAAQGTVSSSSGVEEVPLQGPVATATADTQVTPPAAGEPLPSSSSLQQQQQQQQQVKTKAVSPPASPRVLSTPFTQLQVQALVAQQLKAPRSSSSGSSRAGNTDTAKPQQQQPQQQQQVVVQTQPKQRIRLEEEVEEAVVTQIRPARASSITTGADPSRVWALVAQFDSSKQQLSGGFGHTGSHEVSTGRGSSGTAAAAAAAKAAGSSSVTDAPAGFAPTGVQQQQKAAGDAAAPAAAGSSAIMMAPAASAGNAAAAAGGPDAEGDAVQLSGASAVLSSDSNASDVPAGLRKIRVGKSKAPKASAAAPAAAAAVGSQNASQQQGLQPAAGDQFIPTYSSKGLNPHSSSPPLGVQGARLAGLPPKPRSSNSLSGMAAGSSSSSAGWGTGISSSAYNSSSSKYHSAAGNLSKPPGGEGLSDAAAVNPYNRAVGDALQQEDSWGPFMHFQHQQQLQQQGEGGGVLSSDGGVDGGAWEVLPVMPLSPLKVPRQQVSVDEMNDTPPTPRTSVVSHNHGHWGGSHAMTARHLWQH